MSLQKPWQPATSTTHWFWMNFKEIQSNKDVDRFHIVLRKKRPVQGRFGLDLGSTTLQRVVNLCASKPRTFCRHMRNHRSIDVQQSCSTQNHGNFAENETCLDPEMNWPFASWIITHPEHVKIPTHHLRMEIQTYVPTWFPTTCVGLRSTSWLYQLPVRKGAICQSQLSCGYPNAPGWFL